jgi:hypothetical protein
MKTWLILCTCLLISGCSKSRNAALEAETHARHVYSSSDIETAERALLELEKELMSYGAKDAPSLDIDIMLAINAARLTLLYQKKVDGARAAQYAKETEKYLNRSKARKGRPPVALSMQEVEQIGRQADAQLDVKWKK